jgi:hypothetical protein
MSFKAFDLAHDVANTISSINEVVSISSSLFTMGSGDYSVKFYNNIASGSALVPLGGYWQTVYDASPTASTSTALFDVSFGYAPGSVYNQSVSVSSSQNEKIKVYREMASALLGSPDALFQVGGNNYSEAFFILLKRSLQKDELKKGAVSIDVTPTALKSPATLTDFGAAVNFQQTVGGDYGVLVSGTAVPVGQVWYNAGVIVLPPGAFNFNSVAWGIDTADWSGSVSLTGVMTTNTIDDCVDGLRAHIAKIGFHNQTNLYSTIYFCRATNSEFNYSSNPTFIDSQQRIVVTSGSNILQTRTYITTLGLYDANDNLLAVGKVNKPITKSPDNEAVFRIRLDY